MIKRNKIAAQSVRNNNHSVSELTHEQVNQLLGMLKEREVNSEQNSSGATIVDDGHSTPSDKGLSNVQLKKLLRSMESNGSQFPPNSFTLLNIVKVFMILLLILLTLFSCAVLLNLYNKVDGLADIPVQVVHSVSEVKENFMNYIFPQQFKKQGGFNSESYHYTTTTNNNNNNGIENYASYGLPKVDQAKLIGVEANLVGVFGEIEEPLDDSDKRRYNTIITQLENIEIEAGIRDENAGETVKKIRTRMIEKKQLVTALIDSKEHMQELFNLWKHTARTVSNSQAVVEWNNNIRPNMDSSFRTLEEALQIVSKFIESVIEDIIAAEKEMGKIAETGWFKWEAVRNALRYCNTVLGQIRGSLRVMNEKVGAIKTKVDAFGNRFSINPETAFPILDYQVNVKRVMERLEK